MEEPRPGRYYHFKHPDQFYDVLGTVLHTETKEKLVVYRALYGEQPLYARPLAMFLEEVERPDFDYHGPRFVAVEGS